MLSSSRGSLCLAVRLCVSVGRSDGPPFVLWIFHRVRARARASFVSRRRSARRRPHTHTHTHTHRRDSSMRGTMPCRIASEETNISKRVVVPLCPLSISPCIGNNLSRFGRFRRSRAAQLACMNTRETFRLARCLPLRPRPMFVLPDVVHVEERKRTSFWLAAYANRTVSPEHDGDLYCLCLVETHRYRHYGYHVIM